MNNDKNTNQTENVGWFPLICVFVLVAFMAAVWFMLAAVDGSGPLRVRKSALLLMLGWVALAGFGISAFVFMLRNALDKVIEPHDNNL